MKKALIAIIRFYQHRISPLFGPRCRFYPTCSEYALQCLQIHGVIKGSIYAILRLMRCNILFPGGVDPVPPKKEKKK